jgi:hypothetical protein
MGLKALCRDGVTANRCARVGVPRRHRARPAVVVDEPAVGWPTRAGRPEREPLTDLRVSPGYPAISDVSRWDYRTMVPDTRASWFCAPSGSLQRDTGQPPGRVISGSQTPLGRLLASRSIDQRAGPESLTGARAALSPDDQLLLLIGVVAQADVVLEGYLRLLWVFQTSTPGDPNPLPFEPLLQACEALVEQAPLSPPWRAAVNGALTAAREAFGRGGRIIVLASDQGPASPRSRVEPAIGDARRMRAAAQPMTSVEPPLHVLGSAGPPPVRPHHRGFPPRFAINLIG